MSDESITRKEDKENLLYIAQGIHVEELSFCDDHAIARESLASHESELSLERIGSDVELLSKYPRLGPELLNDPIVVDKTRPFEMKWSFGMNGKVPIKNLSDDKRKQFLFASSHFPIIYDISKERMQHLEGHSYVIKDLACSKTGRWIVTVDSGKSGNLMIWDNSDEKITLVRTIFEPYSCYGIEIVEISGSARYLITIGRTCNSFYTLDFWLWTEGEEKSNDFYKAPVIYGRPVAVCFNPDVEEHIMVVFEHTVVLMVWDAKNKKLTNTITPALLHQQKIGLFTYGTYISKCHECYAVSTKGCISVFGNTLYPKPFEEGELDNSKIFRNSIKVSSGAIHCCTTTSDLIVIVGSRGVIQFFDKKIRIIYWFKDFNIGPIFSISFNLAPKFTSVSDNQYILRKPIDARYYTAGFRDITEELEILTRKDLPEAITLSREPFYVTDCLLTTEDSNVYMVDCVKNTCVSVFHVVNGNVTAIETHDEQHYLLIGYSSGTIILINYEKNFQVSRVVLSEDLQKKNAVTCIKYSPESLHLVCGRENGEIWVLEPILLTPKDKPFSVTGDSVVKIEFALSPVQFAYFDTNRTVILFTFDMESSSWILSGKIRPHYDKINDIMFMPATPYSKLYTISKDRYIVEYDNVGKFEIVSRDRINQIGVPICFTYWFELSHHNQLAYIFVSDSRYKMKFLYQSTKLPKTMILGPAYGCFKDDYIQKMMIVPGCESRYMVFSTKKLLGLHILPPDGNPYKYVGYLAHPNGLVDFKLSHDGQYVFTFEQNFAFVHKWEIRTRGVELMNLLGGKELEPFYCLIDGGATGSLFQEIRDLFYYMQILEQENMDAPKRVSDTISVNEIPDLVRSCGFYPSEFGLENMMIDIRYRNFDEVQKTNEDISFIDFVKLYCNHKPAYGYSLKAVESAFNLLAEHAESISGDKSLSRVEFVNIFSSCGEPMTLSSVYKCLKTLVRNYDEEESFDFLPEDVTFNYFIDEILGIDMLRDKFQEENDSEKSYDMSFDENKKSE